MHPALQHHIHRGDREQARWNMACDYAINPILLDAGLTLPKDVLIDDRFRGMSAERIYNLIEEQRQEDGSGGRSEGNHQQGDGSRGDDAEPSAPSTPGGIGQVLDAPESENGERKSVAE